MVLGPGEMAALTAAAVAHATPVRIPGGSAANVLKGLAGVSGGQLRCEMVGMVGADEAGESYTRELRSHGVEPRLAVSDSSFFLFLLRQEGERGGQESGRKGGGGQMAEWYCAVCIHPTTYSTHPRLLPATT